MEKFQLHHTGIKTIASQQVMFVSSEFQLHHTGIKTKFRRRGRLKQSSFQLHHTGIKTFGIKDVWGEE